MNSNEGGPDAGIVVKQLAAGNAFTCALTATGGVKCWGQNGYGSLGNGQTSGVSLAAVDAVGLSSGVQTISAGGYHACAITTANALLCWGLNEFGQLGSGSSIAQGSGSPVEPTAVTSTVSAMAIGDDHSCVVVASTGGVKCWGRNSYGQLGVDPAATSTTGVAVDVFGASSGFKAVAVGDYHSCAITTQGAVKCWGRNDFGEIGSAGPASGSTYQPVTVAGLSSAAVAVVGGHNYTCAMTDLGGVQCWGNDQGFGYLGNGSESGTSAVPVDAVGLSSGAVALSTSNSSYASHVSALTSGGAVLSWGLDEVGQLGDDPKTITATTSSDVPVAAVGVHNAIAVAAGDSHGCAALAAGGVMCWGQSTPAGSSSSSNVLVPISVSGF
jgi:alpha-tubulin suppressor-like RCC1 family protein